MTTDTRYFEPLGSCTRGVHSWQNNPGSASLSRQISFEPVSSINDLDVQAGDLLPERLVFNFACRELAACPIHGLRSLMNLKEKAQLTYDKLRDFECRSETLPHEARGVYLHDVLTDLADAATRDGCSLHVPQNPTSLQALSIVTQVLDWVREESDLCAPSR